MADDNVDLAEMTALLLELSGYEVRAVHDGAQAIEAARTFLPAVAILDINMPTLDGWAAGRALRAADSQIALIAMTALSQPADFQQSLTAGFDAHLVKPFDANRLVALVARLLEASSS